MENKKLLMVDIKDLQEMTGLSKNKAMQLGIDAGAVVHLGIRRTLYNVQKVQEYIDSKTDAGAGNQTSNSQMPVQVI